MPAIKKASLDDLFSEEVDAFIARIEPAVAGELLERRYEHQRLVSTPNLEMLRERLREGEWVLSNDALVTTRPSQGGLVLNAQHRLRACVLENVPIDMLVLTGQDITLFESLDLGKTRSIADYFKAHAIPNAAQRSSTCNLLFALEEFGLAELQNVGRKVHPAQILQKYHDHGEEAIEDALSLAGPVSKRLGLLSKTNIAGLHRFLEEHDPASERLSEFWKEVARTRRGDRKGDPADALHKAMAKGYKDLIGRPRKRVGATLLAWTAWREGRSLTLAQLVPQAESIEVDRQFRKILVDTVGELPGWPAL